MFFQRPQPRSLTDPASFGDRQPMPPEPAQPFTWGQGGAMMTPDQLTAQQRIAQQMMQADFSPVASPWQGLGRVAENLLGAVKAKRLEKQAAAQQAYGSSVASALMAGDGDAAARAMVDPYVPQDVQAFAGKVWDRAHPKAQEPTEFERTLRLAGIDPASPQARALALQRATQMATPAPQPQLVSDGVGGSRWVTPPSAMTMGGGDPASTAGAVPTAPVGKLRPVGGGSGNATGGFQR